MNIPSASRKPFAPPLGCKPISGGVALSLTAISAVLAGAFPSNYGGITFLAVAIGLFSYVLTAGFNFLYVLMGAGISVAVSLLCGVKFPLALISLCFIPVALAISISVRRKAGLSGTVAASAAVALAISALVLGLIYISSPNAMTEVLSSIWAQYEVMLRQSVETVNSTEMGVIISENYIEEILHTTLMLLPAMAVICCMALTYISAKILRLATVVNDSNEMFEGGRWPVTASLAGSVVFTAAYIIAMFASASDIVYFSATNIMYIMLPAQAIVGLKLMFGQKRTAGIRSPILKAIFSILCIFLLFYNPILLLVLGAIICSFCNFRDALKEVFKNKGNDD